MNHDRTQTGVASTGYRLAEIPHFVQYISPVATSTSLPLGILVTIFSLLDDPGDLARVTRTSRLFRYVALPQLYEKVCLRSRAEIKYVDGRPQGFGGGSPFTMGLNGLATQDFVSYVKELRILGDLDEPSNDDFSKGRVPDTTMMLNTVLRIITQRAARLDNFIWELNAKPTKTLYQGLASSQLTKLTIRFPAFRMPQPTAVIPGMPKLRLLKVVNIDTMCYPDDLSLLLLESKALEDFRLHFSPRMRSEAEPMVALSEIFRRCLSTRYTPKLKHFAIQNYFGRYFDDMQRLCDPEATRSISFLDMFGGARTRGPNVFVDDTWRDLPPNLVSSFTTLRFNEPASQHVKMLQNASRTLEKFYFVNNLAKPPAQLISPETSPGGDQEAISLGREYLHTLTRKHGQTLKHLLLCDQWTISQQDLGDIVRYCPNLEQIAMELDEAAEDVFRIVVQFLPNLVAVRLFDDERLRRQRYRLPQEDVLIPLGRTLQRLSFKHLRYLGAGNEAFEVGGKKQIINEHGLEETIVELIPVPIESLQHVAIWGMDRMDIIQEPSHVT